MKPMSVAHVTMHQMANACAEKVYIEKTFGVALPSGYVYHGLFPSGDSLPSKAWTSDSYQVNNSSVNSSSGEEVLSAWLNAQRTTAGLLDPTKAVIGV
ncbi:hypothetical protein H4219_006240, partial [Mycoemilia scoparia]